MYAVDDFNNLGFFQIGLQEWKMGFRAAPRRQKGYRHVVKHKNARPKNTYWFSVAISLKLTNVKCK